MDGVLCSMLPRIKLETIEEASRECSMSEPEHFHVTERPPNVVEEFPDDYNFIRLAQDALSSEEVCITWLRKYRLLARRKLCIHCELDMQVVEMPCRGDPRCWQCNHCRCTASLRNGSIFMCFNRPFTQVVPFIYLWSVDSMNLQAMEYETDINNIKKVRDFAQILRQVCAKKVDGRCKPCIGGPGTVVEVGVARFSRSRRVVGQYVLAAVGRTTAGQAREVFVELIPNALPETVTSVLQMVIRSGSIVLTSKWKAYGLSTARQDEVKPMQLFHNNETAVREIEHEDVTVITEEDLQENKDDTHTSFDSETFYQPSENQALLEKFVAVPISNENLRAKLDDINVSCHNLNFNNEKAGAEEGSGTSLGVEQNGNANGHVLRSPSGRRINVFSSDVSPGRIVKNCSPLSDNRSSISGDEIERSDVILPELESEAPRIPNRDGLKNINSGNTSINSNVDLPNIVYLDPSMMGHTPALSAFWLKAKKKYRKMRSSQESYFMVLLQELAWREMYGVGTLGTVFKHFVLHLQEQYPLM